jgi:flagellar basal-body rod modification protein FlgD
MKELTSALPPGLTSDPVKPEGLKPKNIMGKDDFMKLLMTQLQNQDPLKPMDSHEFAAQLAQFSAMEQLTNIDKGIQGLKTGQGDDSKLQAIGMIGKKISASGRELDLKTGQEVTLTHTLAEGVKPTKATILDQGGNMVRELDLSKLEKGAEIKWDGKDANGVQLPAAKYTFRVQGVGRGGQAEESSTELSGRVLGVEMSGKTPMLVVQTNTGTQRVELPKVKEVSGEGIVTDGPVPVPPVGAKTTNADKSLPALKFDGVPSTDDPTLQKGETVVDTGRSANGFPAFSANRP